MDALLAFGVAAVISFYGSLQLGLVNVAVIETTLNKGSRHALLLALGGVIPEIPYTMLAITGTKYVGVLESYQQEIGIGIGTLLCLLGVYYLGKRPKAIEVHGEVAGIKKRNSFLKGFGLAMLNPQLIFFWSGILLLLESGALNFTSKEKLIDFNAFGWMNPSWSFALGAAFGAFLILVVFIVLARKFRSRIGGAFQRKLNIIIGLFFIGLGLYSALKNVV